MSFLTHIKACNRHDLEPFVPFFIENQQVGWVRRPFSRRLAQFPGVFLVSRSRVDLHERLTTPETRTRTVEEVVARLADDGAVPPPNGELYRVNTGWGAPSLMLMDRHLVPTFGIRAYGVHLNGYVGRGTAMKMWIAKRSPDRAVAPGQLDNMVAGGQPATLTIQENLIKEAKEEANMDFTLADTAQPVGAITYCMETPAGIKPDTLFCYDLELPEAFQPENTDGEISEFMLLPIQEVMTIVKSSERFKFNVNLVMIDFLIRHGFITADLEPDYMELIQGCHFPLETWGSPPGTPK